MAIVITDGNAYICYSESGGIRKTPDFDEAIIYEKISDAVEDMKRAPAKTENFYVYDTVTQNVCWKWLTDEEIQALKEKAKERHEQKKKAAKRKNYSRSVRKLIYNKGDGRCQLCGRKIKFEDMTLDHIIPLAMNGADTLENLQCTCQFCNRQKGAYLPDDYLGRIEEIFMYQMEKKCGKSLRWKIARNLLMEIL